MPQYDRKAYLFNISPFVIVMEKASHVTYLVVVSVREVGAPEERRRSHTSILHAPLDLFALSKRCTYVAQVYRIWCAPHGINIRGVSSLEKYVLQRPGNRSFCSEHTNCCRCSKTLRKSSPCGQGVVLCCKCRTKVAIHWSCTSYCCTLSFSPWVLLSREIIIIGIPTES